MEVLTKEVLSRILLIILNFLDYACIIGCLLGI
jgi:hypothetical protein